MVCSTYRNLQHNTVFYIDEILSYNLLKGNVLTFARSPAAALKDKQFSGSLTSGKTFAIGYKDIIFDPQIQFLSIFSLIKPVIFLTLILI
ncbi:hypothetical protein GGR08_001108 [Bartonella fuyuanensis]|uniref:Uncharacterized protein n=1 Tax=Bartonella fuyuanensis TaxID=1460968 RepID=A0A840E4S6_9HYPH|nr:hypothetical protein [Bartonella fuyuanensis]